MLSLLIIAVALFALLRLAQWALRLKTSYLKRGALEEEAFFTAAKKVIEDDSTPPIVVDVLEFMAASIRSPDLPRHVAMSAIRGQFRDRMERAAREPASDIDKAIEELRTGLQKLMSEASAAYILATTYRSFMLGWLVRRTIFAYIDRLDIDDKTSIIEREFYAKTSILGSGQVPA